MFKKNANLKVNRGTEGMWFIHSPKHHMKVQLLSIGHSCWFSLVCEEVHDNVPNPFCKKIQWQTHPREAHKFVIYPGIA